MNNKKYGIEGFDAPELEKFKWIDANGKDTEPYPFDEPHHCYEATAV